MKTTMYLVEFGHGGMSQDTEELFECYQDAEEYAKSCNCRDSWRCEYMTSNHVNTEQVRWNIWCVLVDGNAIDEYEECLLTDSYGFDDYMLEKAFEE